jgi:hypothetical protein
MTVAWNDFYKTARWQRLRKLQLTQHPLCKFCLERGIVTAANVVDPSSRIRAMDRIRQWRAAKSMRSVP